ncbi:hypothetical protein BN77_3775 [Rhizobium mesoamericanum STM3625]|uniref:Uncharacterized protein n=1 Tax=Rhizobium mesoamericanum STM3625 TaxID=1211777 RepID=K0PYH5_9HYPH|nr:hypothetical protein BN77_3775 [Rhizobium mesoamericanum STM3625]
MERSRCSIPLGENPFFTFISIGTKTGLASPGTAILEEHGKPHRILSTSASETISIDSLFDSLFRPDLVAAAARGDEKGLKAAEGKESIDRLPKDGLPPAIAITSPQPGQSFTSENTAVGACLGVKSQKETRPRLISTRRWLTEKSAC